MDHYDFGLNAVFNNLTVVMWLDAAGAICTVVCLNLLNPSFRPPALMPSFYGNKSLRL